MPVPMLLAFLLMYSHENKCPPPYRMHTTGVTAPNAPASAMNTQGASSSAQPIAATNAITTVALANSRRQLPARQPMTENEHVYYTSDLEPLDTT